MLPYTGKMNSAYGTLAMLNQLKKLHLGSGGVNIPGWVNIDLDSPSSDMLLDLTKPLPFDTSSVTHIFNEHFIEHITRSEAVNLLIECKRVLTTNGVIRISTPNLRFLIASYISNDTEQWGDLWHPTSSCSLMNEGMRLWGHQFVYDADELVKILLEAGFGDISFQEYKKSKNEVLRGLETRPFHNDLIIEARVSEDSTPAVDMASLQNIRDSESSVLNPDFKLSMRTDRETVVANQIAYVRQLEDQLTRREQSIAGLQKTITDQATHVQAVEAALSQCQTTILNCQAALLPLQNSICNKLTSNFFRLLSLIHKK
jgi:predicted SAM-dependent methyltransferase